MNRTAFFFVAILSSATAWAAPKMDPKASVTTAAQAWAKAFNAHDATATAALYTDDANFVFAFAGQEGKGKANVQQFFTQAFKATPDIAVTLKECDATQVNDSTVVAMCTWDDTFTGPDGKKMTIPTQSSEIYTKQKDGKWLVRVDHASFVPPAPPK